MAKLFNTVPLADTIARRREIVEERLQDISVLTELDDPKTVQEIRESASITSVVLHRDRASFTPTENGDQIGWRYGFPSTAMPTCLIANPSPTRSNPHRAE